eukprot:4470547-Pyramimonas_sp.AAC.1
MEGAAERNETATLETLQYIHAHKTAALLDAAVVSGALLGKETPPNIKIRIARELLAIKKFK